MAITYKPIAAAAKDSIIVYLDGKRVGLIQREKIHAGGYYYTPDGSPKYRGSVFQNLAACKASLDDVPEDQQPA